MKKKRFFTRNREKEKKNGVEEPQQQKEKVRFKWHAPPVDKIAEKKPSSNLNKSTWGYGFSWFTTPVKR